MSSDSREAQEALTHKEMRLLEAMADRIFPPTDTPGAVELGAVSYIEQALADAYAAQLPAYRRGLRQLERLARQECGRGFLKLRTDEQDAVLEKLETAPAAGRAKVLGRRRRGGSGGFLGLVREHVLEGVFGDPQYGGNWDLIAWQLIGFGGQQHGYADAYINKPLDITPIAQSRPESSSVGR